MPYAGFSSVCLPFGHGTLTVAASLRCWLRCHLNPGRALLRIDRGFKPPKSKHGRRTILPPPSAVAVLRAHWRGEPRPGLSDFRQSRWVTPVAGQTIAGLASGLSLARPSHGDVPCTAAYARECPGRQGTICSADFRRLGHGHLFGTVDSAAAAAIDIVLRQPGDG